MGHAAFTAFGDIEAAERIARMNFLPSIYHPLAFGRDIFIPDYVSPYNKAGQTNPLAQFKSQLLSQLAPHLTAPVIKPHRPHTWYKVLIKAIALAIIMAYAPELAPQFLTGLVGAHIATGIVAAVGDAAVQGFCVAANWQKGFSVNEVIETAVTFGTGATGAPLNTLADAAKMALIVAAMNAATQLFEMAIGTSKQFSFQSLALQVTSSLVSAKLNMKGVENESATGLKAALKDGITQTFQAVLGSVLTGQPINVEETLAHSLGNSIGANLQNALKQHFASVSTLEAAKPAQSAPSDATVDATTEASSPHATSQKRQAVQRRAFFERSKAELAALQSKAPSAAEAAKAKAQATRAKRWYDEPQSHARNYDEVLANLNPSDYTLTPASLILKRATAAYFAHYTPLDYAANRAGEIIEAHGLALVKATGSAVLDAMTVLPPVGVERAVAAMGFKAIGAVKFGVFGLKFDILKKEFQAVNNPMRFQKLISNANKQEVRQLLKSHEINLPPEQIKKLAEILTGGRMDHINLKLTIKGDVRLAAERAGYANGYQRMSFEVDNNGRINKVVQTAFNDLNKLVPQRPGEFKNNLYDVKKWKK